MRATRAIPALVSAVFLAGCAGPIAEQAFEEVAAATRATTGSSPAWIRGEEDLASARTAVAALLAKPLGPDDAVSVAMLANRGLQGRLSDLGIGAAALSRARRPENPGFSFSRLKHGGYVQIARADLEGDFPNAVIQAFNGAYTKLYGRVYDDLELEIVNLRLSASAPARIGAFGRATGTDAKAEPIGMRAAYCPVVRKFVDHAVYRRATLGPGFEVNGPAIIEEDESTTVVNSHGRVTVDSHASLLIEL